MADGFNASLRAARNSISSEQRGSYDGTSTEKKMPFTNPEKGTIDVEEGEINGERRGTMFDDNGPREFEEKKDLKRGLKQRHIQMIALAGTIGTGLFLGSGRAIARSGPLGAFLGYSFVGFLVSGVVLSIAEMSALVPLSGGVIRHAEYFVDPALSFANGWNQIYSYMVSIPAELVAAAVLIEFWKTVSNAVWITVLGFCVIASNLFFVRVYGELEFTFASLKIMLIIGVNLMALIVTCGGGPNHESIGFQYWRNPGPFVNYLGYAQPLGGFLGFWTTFNNAIYAYSGIENISLAAAETQSPRRNIPIAAKRIFWRVMIFYILTIFMVGLVVPSNNPDLLSKGGAHASPFVLAAQLAGIKAVPSIINAVVITSAWSSGNSSMLGGSRVLYGLAREGRAPKIFLKTNRFGIPYVAIGFLSLFICLGYMTLSKSAGIVFNWLQDLVSVSTLCNWMVICTVYLRFHYGMRKQGISRDELPWKAPFQPYLAWISLCAFALLLLTSGYATFIHGHWNTETFISSYINIPIFAMLYFGSKFFMKSKIVPLADIPIRQFIQVYIDNPEDVPPPKTGLQKLNILWG